jgi:DNA primase
MPVLTVNRKHLDVSDVDVRELLDHYNIDYEDDVHQKEISFLCPFHDDQTLGSAYFDEFKGVFNCFSCGAGGNVFQFVSQMETCTVSEAEQLLVTQFAEKQTYSVEEVKDTLSYFQRKQLRKEVRAYDLLAERVITHILTELNKIEVCELHFSWLPVCSWIFSLDIKNISKQSKDVLDLYSQFCAAVK